jgi:hypothetical protein
MLVAGSLAVQLSTVHTVRHGIRLKLIAPFIIGGLVGVPIGAALLPYLNPMMFRSAVGVLLIVYCGVMLAAARLPKLTLDSALADGGVGVIGGILGGVAGLVGPAPMMWSMLRGWDKDTQRAVCQSFFIIMQTLTLVIYACTGLIHAQTLQMFALMLPSSLLFAWVGARFYRRLSDTAFKRILLILLLASGVALLGASALRVLGMRAG